MSRKSRFQDLREAKDRRMKKIAIGGCVLLVAVLAFEIPHVLNRGGGASSSPPPATTTTPGTATPAPATAQPGTVAASGTPTVLPNSDEAPSRSKSQLFSFTHFAGKDPFVQQVVDTAAALPDSAGSGQSSSQSSSSSSSSSSGSSKSSKSSGKSSPVVDTTAARSLAVAGTAKISVNGRVQTVRVGAKFPSANPLFRLVSISNGIVRIGIAHGSYSSGAPAIVLTAGKSLTLVDTADGIRYKLRLLAAS